MRILVVDDDSLFREIISEHVVSLGHESVQVRNGHEAATVLYANGEENTSITAVITDMNMPMMTGFELLQYLGRKGWQRPCLLHSSYNEATVAQRVIDISKINQIFPFAQFKPKGDLQHITTFLGTLA